ncbi:MAG: sigma-70 family RNA polymerase sigma factor [Treponema sp.]|jgi:RNA polymerase sigma-70 factor (ECF subfamily)|nr:sigma-70 family RNA polymerase sigma factor [Treponema sp.]
MKKDADDGLSFDEALLVAEIVSGKKDLFRFLVTRYERHVYGMGMSFLRNEDDALDFTQEVFLKVFKGLTNFEGRSRFSTWLYKVAYNTAINSAHRKKEFHSLAEDEQAGDFDTPEQGAMRLLAKSAVREAVQSLPDRYRICIDLFFFYDRSYNEIEAITGFPVNTIKSHVFRAKKVLREKLRDFGGDF